MAYDLAAMARASGVKRKRIVLPAIAGTTAQGQELARIYLRVSAAWAAAVPEIMREYEKTLASQPRDSMTRDSAAGITREVDQADSSISRLLLTLTPALRDWAIRIERYTRDKFRGGVLSAAGVDLSTVLGPEASRDTLEIWLQRNVALVKDVSDQARGRISDAVFRGLQQRQPARDVAAAVRGAVDMSRTRSTLIARDQLAKISATLADERRREAGLDEWEWLSSGKVNAREEHEALDGEVFSDRNPPEDMPGQLVNCGCRQRSILRLD